MGITQFSHKLNSMEIMKKAAVSSALLLSLTGPAMAGSEPALGFSTAGTPYGVFGCKQRAENKLFSIGATDISKSSVSQTIWARYGGTHTIGVWCRGTEVVIMVAGSGDTTDISNEIRSAF